MYEVASMTASPAPPGRGGAAGGPESLSMFAMWFY